jgi:hypothetical protein
MSAVGIGRRRFAGEWRWLVLLAAASSLATGCKSGSWAAKPSWWSFGQTPPATGDGLASAPAFSGDATKPSATAQPYPTTSTPQGYALDRSAGPAAEAAPVTYGVTPPPQKAPTNLAQWSPTPAPSAAAGPIAPQVGPYAAAQQAAPPSPPAASEPAAAWPQQASPPAAAPRMADARASSPDWTGSADAVPPPSNPGSRYGTASRFSGGGQPAAASGFSAPPEAAAAPPAANPFPAPSAAPAALPAEMPVPGSLPSASPSAAPLRRADPGYRPGGTSNYRPTRTSIAGGADSGVQPASFESRAAIAP